MRGRRSSRRYKRARSLWIPGSPRIQSALALGVFLSLCAPLTHVTRSAPPSIRSDGARADRRLELPKPCWARSASMRCARGLSSRLRSPLGTAFQAPAPHPRSCRRRRARAREREPGASEVEAAGAEAPRLEVPRRKVVGRPARWCRISFAPHREEGLGFTRGAGWSLSGPCG
jgi:hypothetical protein